MGNELQIRIAVGSAAGPKSATWRIFTQGNEAYAAHRSILGIEKISFHSSRICRRAFVSEHKLPDGMSGRVLHKWMRAETSPARQGKAVAVLSIVVPTAHLSDAIAPPTKPVTWISPSSHDSARVIQLLFTQDSEADFARDFASEHSEMLAYHPLPCGEAFAVRAFTSQWDGKSLIVNATDGGTEDIVLPCFATPGIARPIQFTLYAQPDELRCFEYTGFKMAAGTATSIFTDADVLSNRTIIDKGSRLRPVTTIPQPIPKG